jgi:hypothetical protein
VAVQTSASASGLADRFNLHLTSRNSFREKLTTREKFLRNPENQAKWITGKIAGDYAYLQVAWQCGAVAESEGGFIETRR